MHRPFFTSKYGFSSGVGYVMRPILLIMWRAFQSFILKVLAYENRSDPVVIDALGTVKKGVVENIKKVSERCWDLHESSERCSVYEQND